MTDTSAQDVAVSFDEAVDVLSDPTPTTHKWETVFQDAGEKVDWIPGSGSKRDGTYKPGTIMEGTYVGFELKDLDEEQRLNSADPDKTQAPLLIFEDDDEERWSTWETYQIKADHFVIGDYYRIECQRERKVDKGHMKSFKIMRDSNHGKSVH